MRFLRLIPLFIILLVIAACESEGDELDDLDDTTSYTLEFVDHEGNVLEALSIDDLDNIELPEGPEREGYVFIEWDIPLDDLTLTEDFTLSPIYEITTYDVVINGPDGTIDAFVVEHGETVALPEPPMIYGYVFSHYENIPEYVTDDIVIEAVYDTADDAITLTFVDYEGTVIDEQTITPFDDFIFPEAPEREGYNFSRWDIDFDTIDFTEDITVKPMYNVATYTVIIEGPKGEIDRFTVEHGESVDVPSAPNIEGYTFETYEGVPDTVTEDVLIEAIYTEDEELTTVYFYDRDGELITRTTLEDDPIEAPEMPDIEGQDFIGWALESNGNPIDLDTLDTGSHAVYAVYEVAMVTIYFDLGDGSEPIETEAPYDSYIDIADFPTVERDDYVFSHWIEAYWKSQVFSGFEVYQTEPITFEAVWDGLTDTWRFDVTDEGAKLTEYFGDESNIIIPDTIGGAQVGIIGEALFKTAFSNDGDLDTLVISENVHTIEDHAFRNNTALESVIFENYENITYIGKWSFQNVPADNLMVPSHLEYIGRSAFEGTNVDVVSFEGNLEYIGRDAFNDTTLSGDIVFPDTLKTIGEYAFNTLDISSVTFNSGLEYIGRNAFEDNKNITELVIPSNVHTIGQYAFSGIDNLLSVTFEPDSALTVLEFSLFADAPDLASITFPQNLTTIRNNVFSNNNALTTLDLPDTAVDFHQSAFRNMLALESFEVPEGITKIAPDAFRNTPSLQDITLPKSLVEISTRAFMDTGLETIDIPENVTVINVGAFQRASALHTIELPENLEVLGHSVFRDAANLIEIVIPETIDTLPYSIFWGATSLQTVHLHNNIQEIEAYAFKDTWSLETVILPDSIHTIGHSSFKNSGLSSIYIPMTVETIDTRVFSGAGNVIILYEGFANDIEDWHWNFNPDDRPLITDADKPEE